MSVVPDTDWTLWSSLWSSSSTISRHSTLQCCQEEPRTNEESTWSQPFTFSHSALLCQSSSIFWLPKPLCIYMYIHGTHQHTCEHIYMSGKHQSFFKRGHLHTNSTSHQSTEDTFRITPLNTLKFKCLEHGHCTALFNSDNLLF